MMRPILFACSLVFAMPATGFAQTCGTAVDRAAADAGIDLPTPDGDAATRPSAPATNESMGVAVMDHLEKPDSVIHSETEGGATSQPAAPPSAVAAEEARRIQAEALLLEARLAAGDGRDDECRDKLSAAESLLAEGDAPGAASRQAQ